MEPNSTTVSIGALGKDPAEREANSKSVDPSGLPAEGDKPTSIQNQRNNNKTTI